MDMMELDGLASVDALFGIAGLGDDLLDVGLIGAAAGVTLVGAQKLFAMDYVQKMALSPYYKAAICVALGAAGGIAVGRYGEGHRIARGAGAGIAAGFMAAAVVEAYGEIMRDPKVTPVPASFLGGDANYNDLLLGSGLSGTSVRDYNALPGQVNGLGDVSARDLSASNGTAAFNGYLASMV